MKVQFFIENTRYGRGSGDPKGKFTPMLEVDIPSLPGNYLEIDGVWYTSNFVPSWHFKDGKLDHVEIVVRPNGGMAERAWHLNEEPYKSENRGDETIP